jgi:hypothetical protein
VTNKRPAKKTPAKVAKKKPAKPIPKKSPPKPIAKKVPKRKPSPSAAGYRSHKESARKRQEGLTHSGQDIGAIPPPQDLARKAAACASLLQFKKTYFMHRFYLPFSEDQLKVTARVEEAVRNGGVFALAMPRGSGKTSEVEIAAIWAAFTGLHKFTLLLGASARCALALLRTIKTELTGNERLKADFPEVGFPISNIENRANRCKGQTCLGKFTNSVWSTEKIVLPTIEGSRASGAIIQVIGIKGSIRGLKEGNTRPSLVIADDIQTRTSAKSRMQCEDRLRIMNGDVMGLAAPGEKFTLLFPCTVIEQFDVADTTLDRDKSPLWTGQRYQMVHRFPVNMGMWIEQYGVLRNDELRNGGDGSRATAFYAEHRAEMDQGAVIAWPDNYKPGEISGVQHAMNLLLNNKRAFWSEYQNQPLSEDLGDGQLIADAVAARVNGLARGTVPLACSKVTAFVDVQSRLFYYVVAAWADDFTGSIIDYGTWPEQSRRYFTAADAQQTLALAIPRAALEAQILAGLGHIADLLLRRDWPREDGAQFRIGKMLVDAGFEGETVKQWCRTTHHAALVMPSHGHGIGASGKPWMEYDRSRCEKLGLHWMIPKLAADKKPLRHVTIDTNYWKTFVAARLLQAVGEKGSLTLWGRAGQDHRMLADHFTAEYWIPTEGRGRKLHEWRMRPGMTENHWFDGLVGAAVAASMEGVAIAGLGEQPTAPRKVIDVRAEQAARKAEFEARRQYRG